MLSELGSRLKLRSAVRGHSGPATETDFVGPQELNLPIF